MNEKMRRLVVGNEKIESELPQSLTAILDAGILRLHGALLFSALFRPSIEQVLRQAAYYDLWGFEFSQNKFHLEDFVEENLIHHSLSFVEEFSSRYSPSMGGQIAFAVLSLSEDQEFGVQSTFSFYVQRDSQVVINFDKLDEFKEALLVKKIESDSYGADISMH